MTEAKSQGLFRWGKYVHRRITAGLLLSSAFFGLIAVTNVFAAYGALAQPALSSVAFRLGAVLLYALPAIGVFRMLPWARYFAIALASIACIFGAFTAIFISAGDGLFMIVTHGLIVYCLASAKSKAAFAKQSSPVA